MGSQARVETRYFISNHPPKARHRLATVRTHWGIENGLHWILDVAFREDESRLRQGHASRNLCLLRRMALNLFHQDTTVQAGVAIRCRKAGRTLTYVEKVLGPAQYFLAMALWAGARGPTKGSWVFLIRTMVKGPLSFPDLGPTSTKRKPCLTSCSLSSGACRVP